MGFIEKYSFYTNIIPVRILVTKRNIIKDIANCTKCFVSVLANICNIGALVAYLNETSINTYQRILGYRFQ